MVSAKALRRVKPTGAVFFAGRSMASGQLDTPCGEFGAIDSARTNDELSDRTLLDRFVKTRDEDAFAAIVERHAGMALGICRRVLRNAHDAEDACQAAFLVLARKADSVRKKESLASWLHGVSFHVATNLKRDLGRRDARHARCLETEEADTIAEIARRMIRSAARILPTS